MKYVMLLAFLILLTIGLCWPFAILWAVNTLAGAMVVHYTFWNWLAVAVIQMSTFGGLATAINRSK